PPATTRYPCLGRARPPHFGPATGALDRRPAHFQLCNIILPMCLGAPASGAYGLSRQAAPRMSAAPRQRGAPPMWPYYNPYAYGAYYSWYQPHYSGWYGRGRPFGFWP